MISYQTLVSYIEELRHNKHITLDEFTKNIISERTYRRYLNENKAFTFDVLVQLVHRLDMRMRDVLMYAFNQVSVKHQEELYFAHYMTLRDNTNAKPYYEKIQNKELETHLGSTYIPVLMKYYNYPKDYLRYAKEKIQFETLFQSNIINRQFLDVLLFILPDLNDEDVDLVIPFLLNLLDGHITLLSLKHQIDLSNTLHTVLKFMTKSKDHAIKFKQSIDSILSKALQDIIKHHLLDHYQPFFESIILYASYTENLTLRKRFIYYHMANRCIQNSVDKTSANTLYAWDEGLEIYVSMLKTLPLLGNEVIV